MDSRPTPFQQWISLVFLLIKRDLKIRYRNSMFGYLWSMLNPLFMMSILTLVFSHSMRFSLPYYPLYILSGLLCWNITMQSAAQGVRSIIDNASLLKKVKVPSWVFPASTIGSATVHMSLALAPYLTLCLILGAPVTWAILQLPIVMVFYFLFVFGIVLCLGTMNVFFRDVGHVLEPVMQLAFYATPVFYPLLIVPEKYHVFLKLNPLYYFLTGFRAALYEGVALSLNQWGAIVVLSGISVALGSVVYSKLEDRFLYHL